MLLPWLELGVLAVASSAKVLDLSRFDAIV